MVDIYEIGSGMSVKIVDEWLPGGVCWEASGMERWLGQIVTVKDTVDDYYIRIVEDEGTSTNDDGHWHWPPEAIERIVHSDELIEYDMYVADENELLSLFAGV